MSDNKTCFWSKDLKIEFDEDENLIVNSKKYEEKDDEGKIIQLDLDTKQKKANELKRKRYTEFLCQQFENFCILTGAGSSFGIGTTADLKGKTMKELWESVANSTEIDLESFCKTIEFDFNNKNLEELLGQANRALYFFSNDTEKNGIITKKIMEIENRIKCDCSLILPDDAPHIQFIRKIANRKLKYPRTRLFTLNYDTLFEQAADDVGCIIIDGFSFTKKGSFRGYAFDYDIVIREKSRIKDEENYVQRVIHLYKLHGSVDWCLHNGDIKKDNSPAKPLLIFPAESKYEHSYEQPFFEMISRFQETLRKSNVTLICIGFSLNDKHVRTMIREAVTYNPGFRLLLVDYDIDSNNHWQWFKNKASLDSRIVLVSETFTDFVSHYPEYCTVTQEDKLRENYGN